MNRVEELIEELNHHHLDKTEKPISALVEMGEEISEYILEHLKHEKRDVVVANLLKTIGKIRKKESIPLLFEYYRQSDNELVRGFAINALEEIGDYSVLPQILQGLEYEQMDGVREQMISLIAKLAVKHPIEVLIENLYDEEFFVREYAAESIYYISKDIIDILFRFLEAKTTIGEKIEIIEVLRTVMVAGQHAILKLQSMTDHKDERIKNSVENALKEINDVTSTK